ncbi:HNH endonuclease [Arthrobacter sp. NPDC056691]|uniref:HNH endonuclease signature motif containing protein n=1 Tax=Arthrobacter sp. NPDC056691 TaxID=3345913 RepID=UPI003673232C
MVMKLTTEERFWLKVEKSNDESSCWLWTAATMRGGRGSFSGAEENVAHRYSWFLRYGPIGKGLFVLQICGNPSCVNPTHLELSATKRNTRDPAERFWEKVDVLNPDDCWLWTAALTEKGYGTFYFNGQCVGAHRWSWESVNGPVPDGLVLDHLCRVHDCVNPGHLEPVTIAENTRRAVAFGVYGSANRNKTHCPRRHPYNVENTYVSKSGSRHCRVCIRERLRKYRHDPAFAGRAPAYQAHYSTTGGMR